jgi:putative transcriptional regulator
MLAKIEPIVWSDATFAWLWRNSFVSGAGRNHHSSAASALYSSQSVNAAVIVKDMTAHHHGSESSGYLDGQLLIAMPSMGDPRFSRAVIYMCAHSADGAMGIVINQRAPNINFCELLEQLNIVPPDERIRLPEGLTGMAVHVGGPVEAGRGFVLHSADYFKADSTLPIDESVCLTATIDILRDIAKGSGPDKALLALGYAGWAPGQLENEIQANGWLHCAPDMELIFDRDVDRKYDRAFGKLGIDLSRLVGDSGHA